MATMQSAVKMFDGYSPVLKNIIKVNQSVTSSFGTVLKASQKAFEAQAAAQAAQSALSGAQSGLADTSSQTYEAAAAQQQINSDMQNGAAAIENLTVNAKGLVDIFGQLAGVKTQLFSFIFKKASKFLRYSGKVSLKLLT